MDNNHDTIELMDYTDNQIDAVCELIACKEKQYKSLQRKIIDILIERYIQKITIDLSAVTCFIILIVGSHTNFFPTINFDSTLTPITSIVLGCIAWDIIYSIFNIISYRNIMYLYCTDKTELKK